MKCCSTVQLREKEIINLCDGMRLGYAEDFEFDLNDGRMTALILIDRRSMINWWKYDLLRIPWDKIECIGEDTVLVKIAPNETNYCDYVKKNCKKGKQL